jgi:hypothetical protein
MARKTREAEADTGSEAEPEEPARSAGNNVTTFDDFRNPLGGRARGPEPVAKPPPTEREMIATAMRRTGLILDRLTEPQRKRVVAALVALYGAES